MRCLAQYHNSLSAEYDGRLRVVRDLPHMREEECTVCGTVFWQFYPVKEEVVKGELEVWREEAIRSASRAVRD